MPFHPVFLGLLGFQLTVLFALISHDSFSEGAVGSLISVLLGIGIPCLV